MYDSAACRPKTIPAENIVSTQSILREELINRVVLEIIYTQKLENDPDVESMKDLLSKIIMPDILVAMIMALKQYVGQIWNEEEEAGNSEKSRQITISKMDLNSRMLRYIERSVFKIREALQDDFVAICRFIDQFFEAMGEIAEVPYLGIITIEKGVITLCVIDEYYNYFQK